MAQSEAARSGGSARVMRAGLALAAASLGALLLGGCSSHIRKGSDDHRPDPRPSTSGVVQELPVPFSGTPYPGPPIVSGEGK